MERERVHVKREWGWTVGVGRALPHAGAKTSFEEGVGVSK